MMRCVVFALVLFVTGCISEHTERMRDVDPLGWIPDDAVTIEYNNRDTISQRTITLLMRWDDTFRSHELPCIVTTLAPDSTIFNEEFDFEVRRGSVTKLTTGYRDSQIGYRSGVVLSQIGNYKFVIHPAVGDPIKGIWAVGLNIE